MPITFKQPGPGDLDWLISTHGSQYSQQFRFNSNFELDIARKVLNFVEDKNEFNRIFIAHYNGSKVGSIAVSATVNLTAFINFLLVKDQYRNNGIARELMFTAMQHAQDNGLQLVQLETIVV